MAVEDGCSHAGATLFMLVLRGRSSSRYMGASLRVPYELDSLQEAANHRRCGLARFMARQTPSFITKSACRSCLAAALARMGRTSCGRKRAFLGVRCPCRAEGRCRLIYVRRLGERANFGFGQWTLFRARTGMPAFPQTPVLPEADRVGALSAVSRNSTETLPRFWGRVGRPALSPSFASGPNQAESAVAALCEDTQTWWSETLAEHPEESPPRLAEGLEPPSASYDEIRAAGWPVPLIRSLLTE